MKSAFSSNYLVFSLFVCGLTAGLGVASRPAIAGGASVSSIYGHIQGNPYVANDVLWALLDAGGQIGFKKILSPTGKILMRVEFSWFGSAKHVVLTESNMVGIVLAHLIQDLANEKINESKIKNNYMQEFNFPLPIAARSIGMLSSLAGQTSEFTFRAVDHILTLEYVPHANGAGVAMSIVRQPIPQGLEIIAEEGMRAFNRMLDEVANSINSLGGVNIVMGNCLPVGLPAPKRGAETDPTQFGKRHEPDGDGSQDNVYDGDDQMH